MQWRLNFKKEPYNLSDKNLIYLRVCTVTRLHSATCWSCIVTNCRKIALIAPSVPRTHLAVSKTGGCRYKVANLLLRLTSLSHFVRDPIKSTKNKQNKMHKGSGYRLPKNLSGWKCCTFKTISYIYMLKKKKN